MECRGCKEKAVEKDDHNGQEQLVCMACGAINEESKFAIDLEEYGGPGCGSTHVNNKTVTSVQLPWGIRSLQYKNVAQGIKLGLEAIENLSSGLSFPEYIRTAVTDLFQKAAVEGRLATCSFDKKTALATACAYLILRCNNWPITISTLCERVQVSLPMFNDVYKLLISFANLPVTSTSLDELVSTYLNNYKIPDKEALIKTTTSVIELEHELWITTGKKPEGILSAATYLVWMSLDISRRSRFTYKKFCLETGLRVVSSAPLRYKELTVALTKLTSQLPWLQGKKLETVHLLQNLNNVLKYSRTLTRTATAKNNGSDCQSWNRLLPLSLAKRKRDELLQDNCANDHQNGVTSKLFVSNSTELTDSDLPDEELSKYIKSSHEVEKLEDLRDDPKLKYKKVC